MSTARIVAYEPLAHAAVSSVDRSLPNQHIPATAALEQRVSQLALDSLSKVRRNRTSTTAAPKALGLVRRTTQLRWHAPSHRHAHVMSVPRATLKLDSNSVRLAVHHRSPDSSSSSRHAPSHQPPTLHGAGRSADVRSCPRDVRQDRVHHQVPGDLVNPESRQSAVGSAPDPQPFARGHRAS
jgi:hypothetical protein